jgi:hypothetical protein
MASVLRKVSRLLDRAIRESGLPSLDELLGRAKRVPAVVPRCMSREVRSEQEVRAAAYEVARSAPQFTPGMLEVLIRELVEMNTPALLLNVVQRSGPVRVVLKPWEGRTVRFRGRNYYVDIGSESSEGIEAFTHAPFAHTTVLYPTAPDHPLYVISIEQQGAVEYAGHFPPYLTHVTVIANGLVTARAERLLHERGVRVWSSERVA